MIFFTRLYYLTFIFSKINSSCRSDINIIKSLSSQSLNELASIKSETIAKKSIDGNQNKTGTLRTNLLRKYSSSTINVSASNKSLAAIIKKKIFGSSITLEDIKKRQKDKSTNKNFTSLKFKLKKLRKSDISAPANFNHVTHLDKPVPIGRRYKLNYKA